MSKKIIISIIFVAAIAFFIFKNQLLTKKSPDTSQPSAPMDQTTNDKPQIVSTNPNPLNDTIIPASQIIEITFNRPLENVGEFKLTIEPKTEFKLELSSDRKTAKIIPVNPYELGVGYTLFIGPETKFDGVGRWGEEKIFHFRTVKYRGI